jgi:hypothetical protein
MEVQTMDARAHSTGSQHRHQDVADLPVRLQQPLTQQDFVPSDHHLQTPPPTRSKRHIPLTDELLQQSEPPRVVHQDHLPAPRLPNMSATFTAAQYQQSFSQAYPSMAQAGKSSALFPASPASPALVFDQAHRAGHEGGAEPHWETLPPRALATIYAALSPSDGSDPGTAHETQHSRGTPDVGYSSLPALGGSLLTPSSGGVTSPDTIKLASGSGMGIGASQASDKVHQVQASESGAAALAELMESAAWRCAVKTACRAWAHGITSGQAPTSATGLLANAGLKRLPFWWVGFTLLSFTAAETEQMLVCILLLLVCICMLFREPAQAYPNIRHTLCVASAV